MNDYRVEVEFTVRGYVYVENRRSHEEAVEYIDNLWFTALDDMESIHRESVHIIEVGACDEDGALIADGMDPDYFEYRLYDESARSRPSTPFAGTGVVMTQTKRGSDEFEAVKSAVYRYGLRRELAGIELEPDDIAPTTAHALDVLGTAIEPIHHYWGEVIDALQAMEKATMQQTTPSGGLLDLLPGSPGPEPVRFDPPLTEAEADAYYDAISDQSESLDSERAD